MQAAVGWTAPPHPRPSPSSPLHRQLNPNSVLRQAQSLTLNPNAKSKRRSVTSSPSFLSCRCSNSSSVDSTLESSSQYVDWDWARWSQHFSEIDQAESYVSVLKFQLEEAIEKEDFLEATKLQKSISEASSKDVVAQVLSELKNAIEEQRYQDASRLTRHAGTGLIGWWVGRAKDTDDSLGRIVRITPELGRYVAKSYSPRQLMIKSTGKPLFEIFLLKNDDGTYTTKVVSFKATNESKPATKQDPNDNNNNSAEKDENALAKDKNPSEDRENTIKDLLSLLKQKMPAFNAQVIKSNVDSVQHLMHEQDEKEEDEKDNEEGNEEENGSADLDADDKVNEEDEDFNKTKFLNKMKHLMHGPDQENQDESTDTDLDAGEKESDDLSKIFLGGVIHNKDDLSSLTYKRVPAEVSQMEKDSFLLHVPQNAPNSSQERDLFIQAASDLMPSDVAETLLGRSKPGSKRRKEREAVRGGMSGLVLSELQHRFMNRLSKETVFNRIPTDSDNLDPFTGLYVGSFGPYGPEVVHLRRRFGHWADYDNDNNGELEFFEYVEAVKLTGDFNVPAGQVTFRARIGNRVSNDYGMFPDSFGVKAFYHGQGRIAKRGYKSPEWVEGELLELTGKGMGPIRGAKLGFLYFVPKRNFLVLFNRLNLPQ